MATAKMANQIPVTLQGCIFAACPHCSRNLSSQLSWFACSRKIGLVGMAESNAGTSVMVYNSASSTPKEENLPKSAMGAISAALKEARPAAVVRLVITMGSPEWEMARTMAAFLLLPSYRL